MGGCLRRMYSHILPMDEDELFPVVESRDCLTPYETACFKALRRLGFLIFICFLMMLTINLYIGAKDNLSSVEEFQNVAVSLPMLPQFILSMRIARKDEGLLPKTLNWFRLTLMFFLLIELSKLFSVQNNLSIVCNLKEDAIKDGHNPSETECSEAVAMLSMITLFLYVVTTLFQFGTVSKLSTQFMRRNIAKRFLANHNLLEIESLVRNNDNNV